MSNFGSKDIGFILVDGYDLLGEVLGLDDAGIEAVLDNTTPLGVAWPRHQDSGSARGLDLTLDTMYNDTSLLSRTVFSQKQGTSRVLIWNVDGNTIGRNFNGFAGAVEVGEQRIASDGKLHRAKAMFQASGPSEEGVVLHAWGQETATSGNTQATSHDWTGHARARKAVITTSSVANPSVITTSGPHGLTTGDKVLIAGHSGSTPSINNEYTATVISATTFSIPVNVTGGGTGGTVTQASVQNGGAAYFACNQLSLGGYTNFVAKARHSADNSTFADLATFAAITTAQKAERVAVTGTVNRYTASSFAYGGAGSSPTVTFMVGFARAVQQQHA